MPVKWQQTKFPGIRFREHPTRRHGVRKDRYFSMYYRLDKKTKEEGLGWGSQNWTAEKAAGVLAELKENQRRGEGPQSLKEKRQLEKEKRTAQELEKKIAAQKNITFDQASVKYITWAKTSKKSWKEDQQRYALHLKPVLGDISLTSIDVLILERLKADLLVKQKFPKKGQKSKETETLSPATVRQCLALVRQIINKSIEWGVFQGHNPVTRVKLPPVSNNQRLRFLSYEEADNLLAELTLHQPVIHDQCILALHCGLRFGEIAKLTRADLDFNNAIIQIRDAKSGFTRQTFMTKEIKCILQQHQDKNPSDLIFPDQKGNIQRSISNTYQKIVDRLGLNEGITDRRDKVVFHTLRHTFASWLAISGTPLLTIKELMGHKSIEMTMRYAHLIPDHKQQAINKMAAKFQKMRKHT